MMKISAFLFAGLIPALIANAAVAADYPAKNLGGSAYLTWRFSGSVNTSGLNPQGNHPPQVVGYACWSSDRLAGMAQSAHMYRYRVMAVPFMGKRYLEPMQGVVIRPIGQQLVTKTVAAPSPKMLEDLPKDDSGEWFASDMTGTEFEQACVDGGIAAGLKHLAAKHGQPIVAEKGSKIKTNVPDQRKLLFSCLTANQKRISLYDAGSTIDYAFGKPNETPELSLQVPRAEASTWQWSGIGRQMNYSIEVPNGDTIYSVYWDVDRLADDPKAAAGVNVSVNDKIVATVECTSDIINNMAGVDLKERSIR
jgi:hypothetical protein